ncbi:probable insulin-like peptide 7 [Gigantopelta aegis]|uniref:probable insulin-like peptide 7 n=1 Tax=Gigantopelta aegis TaxID=1735272 RepID=UPI001B889476|nr:probable insulin-like peptide 7 [Gigantopelta aegis]
MAVCCAVISTRKMPNTGFKELNGNEIFNVWHTDCHKRCNYHTMVHHAYSACQLDPYSQIHSSDSLPQKRTPFLEKHYSKLFLNKREGNERSIGRRSIIQECCHKTCSWEEFGEYCKGNLPRLMHVEYSNCDNDGL